MSTFGTEHGEEAGETDDLEHDGLEQSNPKHFLDDVDNRGQPASACLLLTFLNLRQTSVTADVRLVVWLILVLADVGHTARVEDVLPVNWPRHLRANHIIQASARCYARRSAQAAIEMRVVMSIFKKQLHKSFNI